MATTVMNSNSHRVSDLADSLAQDILAVYFAALVFLIPIATHRHAEDNGRL